MVNPVVGTNCDRVQLPLQAGTTSWRWSGHYGPATLPEQYGQRSGVGPMAAIDPRALDQVGTTSPTTITLEIAAFCRAVSPTHASQFVLVRPEPDATYRRCACVLHSQGVTLNRALRASERIQRNLRLTTIYERRVCSPADGTNFGHLTGGLAHEGPPSINDLTGDRRLQTTAVCGYASAPRNKARTIRVWPCDPTNTASVLQRAEFSLLRRSARLDRQRLALDQHISGGACRVAPGGLPGCETARSRHGTLGVPAH